MQNRRQSALHLLYLLYLAAALGLVGASWSTARAESARQLFIEAAYDANLDDGDTFTLYSLPDCFVGSKKAQAVFCVGRTIAADKSRRWYGVVLTPKRVVVKADLAVLSAKAAATGGGFADNPKGRGAVNRALGRVDWEDEVTWVYDYYVRDGKLRAYLISEREPKREVALPDGRVAKISTTGVSISDGSRLEIAPLPGRPVMSVSIYALPGTKRLIAAIEDAASDRDDAVTDNRFVFSTRGGASRTAASPKAATGRPKGVWCPPHYGALKPLLDRFCRDDFGEDAVAQAAALAQRGALSAEDLAVLFNAYGALYGYTFKQKPKYNRFYYGGKVPRVSARRPWLPPPCRSAFGKYTRRTAPKSLRKARNAVKRLWRKHK